jgi:copper transporter 1
MLWNWYTVDACFLARSWRITSKGAFAGSCIGVILLVLVLEALRRAAIEYDGFLVRKNAERQAAASRSSSASDGIHDKGGAMTTHSAKPVAFEPVRPNVVEQAIRALLHMLQFAVAYFVMLLAMYYNGYIIICIFIGAFLGFFIFGWRALGGSSS